MASSLNSPTPQERWHRFSAATVRAFHRYATWLVSLSWWRFGWYALVLIIVTGLLQKLPPFSLTYYETVVDSAFVGCRKPESQIYAITLERIGIDPGACLFVDDVEVNCEGARRAGINAVHFRDNDQAIPEIRAALG